MDGAHTEEGGASRLALPIGPRDHVQGPLAATVALVEYGDFECAHCRAAFTTVKEVRRWMRGELCYAFRHFPDAERHPHALRAAEAAEAAGAQGRFWEMHDLLCERSPALGEVRLKGYAYELGLDPERFEHELRARVHLRKVREDLMSGVKSGVGETPAFFINELRYEGAPNLDNLLAAIEEAGNRALSSST